MLCLMLAGGTLSVLFCYLAWICVSNYYLKLDFIVEIHTLRIITVMVVLTL